MKNLISLNSLKFSDSKGKFILKEDYLITFSNDEALEKFIQSRYKYWCEVLGIKLTIAPDKIQTLHEIEIKKVFKLVARYCGVLYSDMTGPSRKREYIDAKRIAINICLQRGVKKWTIAKAIQIHHATVLHHQRAFADLVTFDKKLMTKYNLIEEFVFENMNGLFKTDGSGKKIQNDKG